jgi:hypothetical protein
MSNINNDDDKTFGCYQCYHWFKEGKDACKKCNFDLNCYNEEEASELDTNSDAGSEEEEDSFDYENSCDCCVKGWTEPNEFGLCHCWCSNCDNLLSYCRYRCRVINPLTGFAIEGEINKEFLKEQEKLNSESSESESSESESSESSDSDDEDPDPQHRKLVKDIIKLAQRWEFYIRNFVSNKYSGCELASFPTEKLTILIKVMNQQISDYQNTEE